MPQKIAEISWGPCCWRSQCFPVAMSPRCHAVVHLGEQEPCSDEVIVRQFEPTCVALSSFDSEHLPLTSGTLSLTASLKTNQPFQASPK